jgi:hypothetical protein
MTLRAWLIALILANLALVGYGWYSHQSVRAARPPVASELDPQRIKLIPPRDAIDQGVGQRPRACVEWGPFTVADAARAERALEAAKSGIPVESRRAEGSASSFWVYIPPQPSRRAAERLVEDLKGLGVTEYYLVQDDARFNNGISLGLFSTEAAANVRRSQLAKLGVGDVMIQAREGAGARTYLRMRDVPGTLTRRVGALKGDFPAAELQGCQ